MFRTKNDLPRILLIADVPNWVFAKHCSYIKAHLSKRYNFTIQMCDEDYNEDDYDLIYPLAYNLPIVNKIRSPEKYVTGIRSHAWNDEDFKSFLETVNTRFQRVHVISERLLGKLTPFISNVHHVPNGIDLEKFNPHKSRSRDSKRIRVGWAGNTSNPKKCFKEIVEPLSGLRGVELVTCGYERNNLTTRQMVEFYEDIDVYVCASITEGHSNPLVEASAMKRAIVTTDVGSIHEYLKHNHSALIVDRDFPSFAKAICELRDNPEKRVLLGDNAAKHINKYDWSRVALDYANFFDTALSFKSEWEPTYPKQYLDLYEN